MAHEITPWRQPNCDLSVRVDSLAGKDAYSRERNQEHGGGGLYRTAEAVAILSSLLASNNLRYGVYWVLKTIFEDWLYLDFYDKKTREKARKVLSENDIPYII